MSVRASEVGLLRLVAQRLAGPPAATPVEAVRGLVAAQAQDLPGALTSIALRTADRSIAGVRAACGTGEVVRSWPMRGTLHLVAAEDLAWMLALGTPRPLAADAKRRGELGLDDADLDRARELALATVPATREEIQDAWGETGGRAYHLIAHLAQTGVVCWGPVRDDGQPVLVAVDDWIPRPRHLERDEAMGEWALRYFRGHGPASVADLARWTGVPMGDVHAGVALARPQLASLEVDGVEHLMDPATPERLAAHRRAARAVHLLPGFDEFVLGYRDRSAVLEGSRSRARGVHLLPGFDEFMLGYQDRGAALPAEFADRLVPGNNGVFRRTLVAGGRVLATWRTQRGRLELDPFAPLPPSTVTAAEKTHARLPT